jgi:hypothetical protein
MQIAGEPLGRVIDRFGVKVGPPTIYARCPVSPQADMAGRFMGARLERSIAPARLALRKIGSPLRTGEPDPFQCAILDLSRPEEREGADRPHLDSEQFRSAPRT